MVRLTCCWKWLTRLTLWTGIESLVNIAAEKEISPNEIEEHGYFFLSFFITFSYFLFMYLITY